MDHSKLLRSDIVFNQINREFVSLHAADIKETNVYIQEVLNSFITRMKNNDEFLMKTFKRFVFAGSFYKGTKITKPEEFDINIVIKLPVDYKYLLIESSLPGFIKIKLDRFVLCYQSTDNIRRTLLSFLDQASYLNQEKFRCWMERILSKTMNQLLCENGRYLLPVESGRVYNISIRKSGPAFTLCMKTHTGTIIDVDLVPVLEFNKVLPKLPKALSMFRETNWFAVPKPLIEDNFSDKNLYWRLSFSDQEKAMLALNGGIKPVIRQIKKLRDTENWICLRSYYIETVCYHMLQEEKLQDKSLTMLLFQTLKRLHKVTAEHRLHYFWDSEFNLLKTISPVHLRDITNRLTRIIQDIQRSIASDRFVIAKYILTKAELDRLKRSVNDSTNADCYLVKAAPPANIEYRPPNEEQRWCSLS